MPYPEHHALHQRIQELLAAVVEQWDQHALLWQELDWWRFHDDGALLARVQEHSREHLRYLLEIVPRDPGGPAEMAARARSLPRGIASTRSSSLPPQAFPRRTS